MTEVIHHEDSSNSGLMVVLIIVVIAIGVFLLWKFLPAKSDQNNQPSINLNINPGTDSTGGNGGATY